MQRDEWEAYQLLAEDGFEEWIENEQCAVSLRIDNKTVSILGWIPLPNSGAHIWLFFDKSVAAPQLRVATNYAKGILQGLKEVGFKWVQTPVKDAFPQGKRWIKLLGFTESNYKEDMNKNGIMYTYWTKAL